MGGPSGIRRTAYRLVAAVLVAAAGCADADAGTAADGATRTLNIHVSGQLRYWGDAVRAGQLALEEAGGTAGAFKIRLVVHDEGSPDSDISDPEKVRRNAEAAARDPDAIAYVGDIDSGSTAISAPILNRAGLLQVTPAATYVGLTRSEGAAPDEPEKFRPTGRLTLARVIPADHVQARAGVVYARALGTKRLGVVADQTLYGPGLAQLVLSAAADLGLPTVDGGSGSNLTELLRRAREVTAAGADAVYFASCGTPGDMLDLVAGVPDVKVFTGDCYLGQWRGQEQLAGRFFVTAPGGGLEETAVGALWYERWWERIGTAPDDKLAFCYEAMHAVLAAIERAGADGDDRSAVVHEFFATRDRDSVLGRYSIDRNGDTTLRSYGGFTYRDGSLRFDRVLDTAR